MGAIAIHDPQPGTAPGLICPVGETGKVIYAVPGVPYEMQAIVSQAILPDLRRRAGESSVILSRTLRTWGESESGLAERLADRIAELDRTGVATIAFLASGIEGLKVRVTVKAPDESTAAAGARRRGGRAAGHARADRVRRRRRHDGVRRRRRAGGAAT